MIPRLKNTITIALIAGGLAEWQAGAATRGEEQFTKVVLPVFNPFCWDCHGDDMDKGGVALDKFKTYADSLKDRKFWGAVSEHISTHVMPPEGKPKPSLAQRDAILQWIDDAVMWEDPAKPDPGHITLRRLNRAEYNNTVRDVFLTILKPASSFPTDDTGYGFDNIGDVLTLSPLLMEKYLRAARQVVEDAVWMKAPERVVQISDAPDLHARIGEGKNEEFAVVLYSNGELTTQLPVEREAPYHLVLEMSAEQCGTEKARYAIDLDSREIATGEISEEFDRAQPDRHWQRVTTDVKLRAGKHRIAVRFLNDATDPGSADPRKRDRNLLVRSITIAGPLKFQDGSRSKFCEWLLDGKKTRRPAMRLEGEDFDCGPQTMAEFAGDACICTDGYVHRGIEIPQAAEYTVHFLATGDQGGKEPVKMRVKFGGQELGVFDVTAQPGNPQRITKKVRLPAGRHEMEVWFINDSTAPNEDRNLHLHEVAIEAPGDVVGDVRAAEFTRAWIARLGLKSFRRPIGEEEIAKFARLAEVAYDSGEDFTGAVRLVGEAMLCSPNFLFRGGAKAGGPAENGVVPIDEFNLASRLSYFLWSSCPDEELLRLASQGELRRNFELQVRRMIGDWKARALTENFAGQWLQLRDVGLVGPDQRRFPDFNGKLAFDMKRESELYFEHILRENRNVLEFLDSDYSFLNERLARFYGVPDVRGSEFQKVSLAGTPRGGILTHGSILTITSHPTRTSPVKRGKFLLENILGTPPPPPPRNVPAFKEDRFGRVQGTLRQRFEAHRANPSCASCHAFLDPMGFAFEHFDAIGRWRDKDNFENIDATGQLLTGQKFDGIVELRKVLADVKKKDFLRSLGDNLLVYALGRGLDYSDKPFRDEILRRASEGGSRFQDIILAVGRSIPFQMMRADEAKDVAGK